MTTLSAHFGHEENLSKYIATSGLLTGLIHLMGAEPVGKPELEVRVAEGAAGRMGRLDVLQATNAGNVIFETQYGTSDRQHRERFAGYASSIKKPLVIVWAAESFRAKDVEAVRFSKTPVLCVELRFAKQLALRPIHSIQTALGSLDDRIKAEASRIKLAKAFKTQAVSRAKVNEKRVKRHWAAYMFLKGIRDKANEIRREQEYREEESARQAYKAEQAKDWKLEEIKQEALDAYCDWLGEERHSDLLKVGAAYQKALQACRDRGFEELVGLPCVDKFLAVTL